MPALDIETTRPGPGWAEQLKPIWRDLERVACQSMFQCWTWLGCQADVRFDCPVLITARQGEAIVGLALFNQPRRGGPLWLHETGRGDDDATYIEHNAPLLNLRGPEREAALTAVLSRALDLGRVVHLSGVTQEVLEAARRTGGVLERIRSEVAPIVHLTAIDSPEGFFGGLSRNTRQQLRRADRLYGGLVVIRAETKDQAFQYFSELRRLHSMTWQSRGKPGAFATEAIVQFHLKLIEHGVDRNEVDVLKIQGPSGLAGYLYNFRFAGRVLAYQSGFDYEHGTERHKPGLSCHAAAIAWYINQGAYSYDFLAGESQYKLSLASAQSELHWLILAQPSWHRSLLRRFRKWSERIRMASSLHSVSRLRDVAVLGRVEWQ